MKDVQRYTVAPDDLMEHAPVSEYPWLAEVVLAADAERAIREAVEAALDEAAILAQGPLQKAREQAIRDAIDAVNDMRLRMPHWWVEEVLTALRALLDGDA